jgi:hypothetical protein
MFLKLALAYPIRSNLRLEVTACWGRVRILRLRSRLRPLLPVFVSEACVDP